VEDEILRKNPCRLRGADQEKAAERPTLTIAQVLALPGWAMMWRVSVTVAVGDWGELTVFETVEDAPPALKSVDYLWAEDSRKRAALLRCMGSTFPYIAVWPADGPEPSASGWSIEGVVLAEPNLALTCFACGETVAGLYPDTGLPYFSANVSRHDLISGCRSCGADFATSRVRYLP